MTGQPYGEQPENDPTQQTGGTPPPNYGGQPGTPPPNYGQPGPPPPGYGAQPGGVAPLTPGEERGWSVGAHLGGVFLSFLVPLIVWLVFRERSRFLDHHGKEALNFQITLAIAYVVGFITAFILIGFLILLAAWVCAIIFSIMAAIAANRGEYYKYPLSIRLVK
ncbi:DUF4870 domain-containing protein [Bogoriella caseilytica]|uniref:Tic20 family protein n=1 Tax=Bogoriella caseilytica TaxID=56055 RepID=A0A3N2B9F7_9MICO|nr:DUF4870 domain-containing protein [Bogoriella caseilytica]ROR71905.1 hypothetical protein EDD31_0244 [Bogoriella caseilytica]